MGGIARRIQIASGCGVSIFLGNTSRKIAAAYDKMTLAVELVPVGRIGVCFLAPGEMATFRPSMPARDPTYVQPILVGDHFVFNPTAPPRHLERETAQGSRRYSLGATPGQWQLSSGESRRRAAPS